MFGAPMTPMTPMTPMRREGGLHRATPSLTRGFGFLRSHPKDLSRLPRQERGTEDLV